MPPRRRNGPARGRSTRRSAVVQRESCAIIRSAPSRSLTMLAGTPTPVEQSDEEIPNASPEEPEPEVQENDDNDQNEDEDDAADDDEDGDEDGEGEALTPAPEPEVEESTPRTRGRVAPSTVPQRRRPGRPPKRPVDWDDADGNRAPSETPKRRGGFRGGNAWRGGRWKNRGMTHTPTEVTVDGEVKKIVNDELELPKDPDGEERVDKDGYLKNGREYRVRTFTIAEKGDRLYMLSPEPARCSGFRDSYLFFQKHRRLFKILLTDDAKKDLIERDLLPHSYKGRNIGVVTARSVFREFGSKIVIGGKKITDDYAVAEARGTGDVEGELAVPEDTIPTRREEYDRNRYVAWHGASAVYHSGVPTIPMPMEKTGVGKKRKVQVTGSNWMLEHARAARYVTFVWFD